MGPHISYCSSLKDGVHLWKMVTKIWLKSYQVFEHFLLSSNIVPLSGWVPGTCCQMSAGAQAPVVPSLTKALVCYDIFHESKMARSYEFTILSSVWVVSHNSGSQIMDTLAAGSSVYICSPLDNFPFLSHLTLKQIIYLFRNLWIVVIEINCENGSKVVMGGSKWAFVKVVGLFLFHWILTTCHI